MICHVCGHENKDDARFCEECGSILREQTPPAEASLGTLQMAAEGYTGNIAAAKKIVEEQRDAENPLKAVREACIEYIRSRDNTLFRNEKTPLSGAQELRQPQDLRKELIPLDYEERIVVLMRALEGLSVPEIAKELGISVGYVRALLQSAFVKNYPEGFRPEPAPVKEMPVKEIPAEKVPEKSVEPVKEKTPADKQKMIRRIQFAVIAVIAIALGVFLGVHTYAGGRYKDGVTALEAGDYDTAVTELEKAVSWGGGGEEAVKLLADAYMGQGEYAKAVTRYTDYYKATQSDEARQSLITCYGYLAEEALAAGDQKKAVQYLTSQFDLDGSEATYRRLQAVQEGGTYTDEKGNVYNIDGRPELLICTDAAGTEQYRLQVLYDDDGHFRMMKAYTDENGKKSVYGTFSFEEGSEYELSWYPAETTQDFRSVRTVTDAEGNILQQRYQTASGVTTYDYTYTYGEDSRIASGIRTQKETGAETQLTYTYNGTLLNSVLYQSDDDLYAKIHTHDAAGRLTSVATVRNMTEEISRVTYEYDTEGRVSSVIETQNEDLTGRPAPLSSYIRKEYMYEGNEAVSCIIRDEEGTIIGTGTHVAGSGWICLYNEGGY